MVGKGLKLLEINVNVRAGISTEVSNEIVVDDSNDSFVEETNDIAINRQILYKKDDHYQISKIFMERTGINVQRSKYSK